MKPTRDSRPRAEPPGSVPCEDARERDRERPRRKEIGGPDGPEPTRYGDWERNGRCTDF